MAPKVDNVYESLHAEILGRTWGVGEKLPTEHGLAERFGVSRATIGKAITKLVHDGLVERRTKAGTKVLRNSTAPARAPLLLDAFGFISPGRQHESMRRMWSGFQDAAGETGRRTLTMTFGLDVQAELEIVSRLAEFDIKGAVLAPMLTDAGQWGNFARAFERCGHPIVLVGTFFAGSSIPAIVGDSFHAGYTMTRYLIDRGLRRIGFLINYSFAQTSRERFLGYRWAMDEAKLPMESHSVRQEAAMNPNFTDPLAEPIQIALSYLREQSSLEGVVCGDYPVAAGLLAAAKQLGICVPQDLKVVGIDNMTSIPTQPGLTTYDFPHEQMGAKAFELLSHLVAGEPVNDGDIQLRGRLIERSSV